MSNQVGVCPKCKSPNVRVHHDIAAGTVSYHCEQCGHYGPLEEFRPAPRQGSAPGDSINSCMCPKCKSLNVETERRPNGDSRCLECGYRAPTQRFVPRPNPNPAGDSIKGYRKLNTTAVEFINGLKELEDNLGDYLKLMEILDVDQRWLSIARTDLQKGFMAAVRSIAQPESRL